LPNHETHCMLEPLNQSFSMAKSPSPLTTTLIGDKESNLNFIRSL
jgi:hypothetical protein